jgi:hypothetical protein
MRGGQVLGGFSRCSVAQLQGGGHSSSMQLRYREVDSIAALCSSGTGRWAKQLNVDHVQL